MTDQIESFTIHHPIVIFVQTNVTLSGKKASIFVGHIHAVIYTLLLFLRHTVPSVTK